jgi:hypothetical protein
MPYVKCEACRVRVYRAGEQRAVFDSCPECGRPLEEVRDLATLVGFRSVQAHRPPADPAPGYEAIAHSVAAILAQRRASERRSRLQGRRWTP